MERFYIPTPRITNCRVAVSTNITSRYKVIARLCATYWSKEELVLKSDDELNKILYDYGFAGHINDKVFKEIV